MSINFALSAQNKTNKGYIIKNNGEKIFGYFKKKSFSDSPDYIDFRTDSQSDFKKFPPAQISEFFLDDNVKFTSALVKLDLSSDKIANLSYLKEPEFIDKHIFLKVILEGKANLFVYNKKGIKKYFYSIEKGEISQLIYKRYYKGIKNVAYNNTYRQQISSSFFDCKKIKQKEYTSIGYNANSLIKFFIDYNSCQDQTSTVLYKNESKVDFSIMPRIGVFNMNIGISHKNIATLGVDFGSFSGLRYGILGQARYDNWTIFLGFESNSKVNKTVTIKTSSPTLPTQDVTLEYKSFEVLAGIKYGYNLDENSTIYVFGGIANESRSELKIDYTVSRDFSEIQSDANVFIGLGYSYNKFNLDAKMTIAKNFFPNSSNFNSKITEFGLMLGYEIF